MDFLKGKWVEFQEAVIKEFVSQSSQRIASFENELKKWASVIPFEQMTMEDFADAFPDKVHIV